MYQIFINDEEVVCESSFDIEEQLANPSSIVLYKVYPKSWKGTNRLLTDYYFPEDYSKCKILKNNNLYFVGIVKNSGDMDLNPFKPHYCSLQILDYSTLLSEGDTLDYVITDKTVTEAINQVIDSIKKYGFVVGNIQIAEANNTLIGAYSTNEKAPYDVFQYLAQISQSRWSTRLISENEIAIDFIDYSLVNDVSTIDNTTTYFKNNKIIDINYSYSTSDYRNKQVITSDEVTGSVLQNQNIVADGLNNEFDTEQTIAVVQDIKVNGVSQEVITKEEYELGIVCDFYYEQGTSRIISVDTIVAGNNIVVSYYPLVKGREVISSPTEISRIMNNLGIDGTISRYESRNDATSDVELLAVANNYVKYKGKASIELTILSEEDFLNIGNKYYYNSPLERLKDSYLVTKKVSHILQAGEFIQTKYEYTLSNNYDTEDELNYFDNQRSKNSGNIEKGKFIDRNIDIENVANIVFDNLSISEIVVSNDNQLNSSLNSPFVS